MLISVVMEIFQMVFLSLPRSISKWVSVEQYEYLYNNELYLTNFPLNIYYVETPLKWILGIMEICLSWKTFMQSHRSGALRIWTLSTSMRWNLFAMKRKIIPLRFCYRHFSMHLDILDHIKRYILCRGHICLSVCGL